MTDTQILDQIRNGNPPGLEALFQKYYTFLVRTAFYVTNNKQASEDLAQELMVKIWDRRDKLENISNLKGYLARMIRNIALDHLEKHHSGMFQSAQFLYFQEQVTELSDQQSDDLKEELSRALSKLPPKCRLIFSLNRLEGLTNDEIADYLEISKRTVETQISNALKHLRVELKSVWDQYFLTLLF